MTRTTPSTAQPVIVRGRVAEGTVLAVAAFGAFLAFLDATVVNVAFPSIRESFPDTSISELSWVLNAYNIVFAAFLVVCGRIADLLGRRRTFALGVLVFTVASLLCAIAPSVDLLVAARAVQALGAALLVPASLAIVVEAFPPERRSHAVGLWGASAAVAAGLGPPIGGALVEVGDWRWAFLVNLPFGVLALVAARGRLVESRAPGRRRLPDLRGASLLAASLALVNLALVKGNDWGWGDWATIASFVGGALFLVGFVISSRVHPSPLLDPALLRIRAFVVSDVVTIVAGAGFYAYLLTNILWLQYVWGYSVLEAGLALVPGAVVAAVVAALLGPVAERRGYRLVIVPGAVVWCLAYVWYVTATGVEPDFLREWLPGQVLSGLGVGATLPVLGSAALAAVPGGRYATASAVASSARQVGGVLGIALLVVIIGSPTSATAVDDLQEGWIFSAACFGLVAVLALALGRVRSTGSGVAEGAAAPAPVFVPGQPAADGDELASVTAAAAEPVPLLDALPPAARERLAASGRLLEVPAGAYVVRAGDPADAMFLVRSGRLEVLVGDQPVRELRPGAALGELALLTGGRRSASVRARRDSVVVEVSRAAFDEVVGSDERAALALATALAGQLRDARPARSPGARPPVVVAVLGVGAGSPTAAVADVLAGSLAEHLRVARPDDVGPEVLERAERDADRVLIVADGADPGRWAACLRQADQVVVVAHTGTRPPLPWPGRPDCDVVLVGPPRAAREEVVAWSAALTPWHVVHATDDDLAGSLAVLGRRLAGRSVGLALAGGGARAFAHIGVLRELEEAGVVVDRVSGASLGAIIAGGWARGLDGAAVHAACYEEFVRRKPFSDYTVPRISLARGRRTLAGLRRQLGDERIEDLPRLFRCTSVDLIRRTAVVHRSGDLVEAVMASVSLPVLFPPRRMGDHVLVDGGVLDNLPVGPLVARAEGPVVGINVSMGGGAHRPVAADGTPRPPRIPGIGETLLRVMMIGSGGATDAARAQGVTVVTPPSMGVGLLEFHQLDRMVEAGRTAARSLLEATEGRLDVVG